MSGTGYYREALVPPEHRGKTWPHRVVERGQDGEQAERMVQSPFPPVHQGNPAEQVEAFRDFQNWQGRNHRAEHPEDYCEACGIRYAVAICPKAAKSKVGCGSGRTVLQEDGGYRCVSCGNRFRAARLCGPCIGARAAAETAVPA